MKKCMIAALMCLLIAGLAGCGNNETAPSEFSGSSSEPAGPVSNYFNGEEYPYQMYTTPVPSLVVIGNNESGKLQTLVQATVSFLKDGSVVAAETSSYRQVSTGQKFAFSFLLPESYDDIQVEFTSSDEAVPGETNLFSDLQTSFSKEADGVHVNYRNAGDTAMNFVKFQVIYYQKNKVVGCETVVSTMPLEPNEEKALVAPPPKTNTGAEIAFTQCEVLPVEVLKVES